MKYKVVLLIIYIITNSYLYSNNIVDGFKTKDEIGIHLYSMFINFNYGLIKVAKVEHSYFNGIIYKRHFDKNSLRIGCDIIHYKYNYNYEDSKYLYFLNEYESRTLNDIGKLIAFKLKGGYEKKLLINKRLVPFIGFDVFISYENREGSEKEITDIPPYFHYRYYKEKNKNIGLASLMGLRYSIISRFSITLEADVNFYLKINKEKSGYGFTDEVLEGKYYVSNNYLKCKPVLLLYLNYSIF